MVIYNIDSFAVDSLFHINFVDLMGPATVFDSFSLDQGVVYTSQVDSGVILIQDNAHCNAESLTDGCMLGQVL